MPPIETPPVSVDQAVNDLMFLLPRVFKALKRGRESLPPDIAALLRGAPFSGRHFIVLLHLADAGSLSISALSERLSVTLPTVSIVVNQLASYGLVERQEDPADRRRTLVRIDPMQREWVEAALAERTEPLRRTMLRLDPAERAAFLRTLRLLAEEAESQTIRTDQINEEMD